MIEILKVAWAAIYKATYYSIFFSIFIVIFAVMALKIIEGFQNLFGEGNVEE